MRVLDRVLAAGSRHRLDLAYTLATPAATSAQEIGWGDGAVSFDLWMSDLHPGRYLEMWLPANLCHDRFALTLDVAIVGAGVEHAVLSNGAGRALGGGTTRIEYPPHFTSLSPLLVVAPEPDFEIRRRQVALAGRTEPVQLLTAAHAEAGADVDACEADIAGWLTHQAVRYGPWAHGSSFVAVLWGAGRGMEYDGGTTASVGALEHEVFHSLVRTGGQAGPGQRRVDRRGLDQLGDGEPAGRGPPLLERGAQPRGAARRALSRRIPGAGTPRRSRTGRARGSSPASPISSAVRAGCAPPWPPGTRPTPAGW